MICWRQTCLGSCNKILKCEYDLGKMTHTMHCSRGASQGKVVVVIGDVVMLAQAALSQAGDKRLQACLVEHLVD